MLVDYENVKNAKQKKILFLITLILPLVILYPAIFTSNLVRKDALWLFSPHFFFLQRSLRAFHLPFWNPYIFTGQPELASAQWGILYPIEWIGLFILPVYWYVKISLYFHTSLLILAGWFLTKKWGQATGCKPTFSGGLLGAMGITFSGFYLGHMYAGHISFIQSLPWYVIGIAYGIKWINGWQWGWLIVPLSFVMAILAGGIAILPYFALLSVVLWFAIVKTKKSAKFRSMMVPLSAIIAVWILVFLISGPQLLPAIELSRHSVRRHGMMKQILGRNTLNLKDLYSIFIPAWYRWFHPQVGYWEKTAYIGPILAGLAIFAAVLRRSGKSRYLLLWAVFFILISSPVGLPLLVRTPILNGLRVPARAIVSTSILLILAGIDGYENITNTSLKTVLWVLAAITFLVPGWGIIPTRSSKLSVYPKGLTRLFQKIGPQYRILSEIPHAWNMGMQYKFLHLGGNEPLLNYRSALLNHALNRQSNSSWMGMVGPWPGQSTYSTLWDLYGVKFALVKKGFKIPKTVKILQQDNRFMLVENHRALPIAYLSSCGSNLKNLSHITSKISSETPSELLYLEKQSKIPCIKQHRPMAWPATISNFSPEKVSIRINAQKPGYLVFSMTPYPGWKAQIDGKITPIEAANIASMAVQIETGPHEVQFYFIPFTFYWGLLLSLAGLLLAIGLAHFGLLPTD